MRLPLLGVPSLTCLRSNEREPHKDGKNLLLPQQSFGDCPPMFCVCFSGPFREQNVQLDVTEVLVYNARRCPPLYTPNDHPKKQANIFATSIGWTKQLPPCSRLVHHLT